MSEKRFKLELTRSARWRKAKAAATPPTILPSRAFASATCIVSTPTEAGTAVGASSQGLNLMNTLTTPTNLAIYDVNTIANYDPEIIPLLDAPIGAVFVRNEHDGAIC